MSREIIDALAGLAEYTGRMADTTILGEPPEVASAVQGVYLGCLAALAVAVDGPPADLATTDLGDMATRGEAILNNSTWSIP